MSDMMLSVVLQEGEIPESLDGGPSVAEAVAARLDFLDELARRVGVTPLGDFSAGYADRFAEILADGEIPEDELEAAFAAVGEAGPWFDPAEGLRTVRGLVAAIGRGEAEGEGAEGLLVCLGCLRDGLEFAESCGTRFHLADTA